MPADGASQPAPITPPLLLYRPAPLLLPVPMLPLAVVMAVLAMTTTAANGGGRATDNKPSTTSMTMSSRSPTKKWRQDTIAITFFLDPTPTLRNYQLVKDANFTVMLGVTPKSHAEMLEQARLCKLVGLKCVLNGPPVNPAEDTCHGSIVGNGSNVDLKTLPPPDETIWGYYLWDEPPVSIWPTIKQQQDRLHAAHPSSLVFINLAPLAVGETVILPPPPPLSL